MPRNDLRYLGVSLEGTDPPKTCKRRSKTVAPGGGLVGGVKT